MKIRRIFLLLVVVGLLLMMATTVLAQGRTHVVQPGETLFSIARRYGLTVQQVAAANGITNPALIYAGQVLTIPGGGGTPGPTPTGPQTYTVQPGDTLFRIARRFGTSVDTLVRLNGLANADVLYVGQILLINPAAPTQPPVTPPPTTTPPSETITYTVQPGDTLGRIALRFGTSYQQIAALNNITNPDVIYPGQVLTIRRGGTATPVPTTPVATTAVPTTAVPTTAVPTTAVVTTTPTTPTFTPTATATATATLVPSNTPTPTATNIPVQDPSPTPIDNGVDVPANAPNRLANAGFEGRVRPVIFPEVNLYEGWEPFYCDEPYTPEKCPALRRGTGNPEWLMMGRPEYKPTDVRNRVHSGTTAQQWFCFWRTCRAGVFQTVTTTPGATCVAGAWVQSWSSNGTGFTSDLQTLDQRANSTWFIRVDPSGGINAFADGLLISRGFGYSDGIYDKYVNIEYEFIATGTRATIFFENLRLWPVANNDNYIDDAYVRCSQ